MTRNLSYLGIILGSSVILAACNTVEGTMQGASRDLNAVSNSMDSSRETQHTHEARKPLV